MMGRFTDLGVHLVVEVGSARPPLQLAEAGFVEEVDLSPVLLEEAILGVLARDGHLPQSRGPRTSWLSPGLVATRSLIPHPSLLGGALGLLAARGDRT